MKTENLHVIFVFLSSIFSGQKIENITNIEQTRLFSVFIFYGASQAKTDLDKKIYNLTFVKKYTTLTKFI